MKKPQNISNPLFQTILTVLTLSIIGVLASVSVQAHESASHSQPKTQSSHSRTVVELPTTVVQGKRANLLSSTSSASEGVANQHDIQNRPILRTGEMLEFVPGLVVTQHSGSGKANQYFMRGYNLDHGTDAALSLENMPINMRTHGHGQGYADVNFIIPETMALMSYHKGGFLAEDGDFSNAGSIDMSLSNDIKPQVKLELGENGYRRGVLMGSKQVGLDNNKTGKLTGALELQGYDGPWTDIDEDVKKVNALARWQQPVSDGKLTLTAMAYDNSWNSADQIPQRAVDAGLIDRLGSLDKTVGGESHRYSLSGQWKNQDWDVSGYAINSGLNLFSNFTYFQENTADGDQFEQVDKRTILGGEVSRSFMGNLGLLFSNVKVPLNQKVGVQLRHDNIDEVGLHATKARKRLSTVRSDAVKETSAGLYWQGEAELSERLDGYVAARYDHLWADVDSNLAANSGTADDGIASFKAGLTYYINDNVQSYVNVGQSFHSNDVRGATITQDPASGDPADKVDMLVRGQGAEFGLRYANEKNLNLSMALWMLESDSELLFVGDAGNTEPSRSSRRHGVELTGYYWLDNTLSVDATLAWTDSEFTKNEVGEGNYIDGSVPFVASLGVHYEPTDALGLNAHWRHVGKRALNSFNTEKSDDFNVVNVGGYYKWEQFKFGLDVLNVFDSKDHDIDYLYESQLAGENAPVEDNHFHPIEPRTVRASVAYTF